MVTIVRDRVADLIKKGLTLEQVKAARPSRDYDARVRRDQRVLDDGDVRRGGLQDDQCEVSRALVWRSLLSAVARHRRAGAAWRARRAAAAALAARRGAGRLHRLLGVGRHRGLALAHGDAGARATSPACRSTPPPARSVRPGIRRRTRPRAISARPTAPPAIMRMPGRLHITWQDDTTLKIETDHGTQTRLLHFGGKPRARTQAVVAGLLGRELGRHRSADPARPTFCRSRSTRAKARAAARSRW